MDVIETPWGPAQGKLTFGEGILMVDAAVHGGFFVPEGLRDRIPVKYRQTPSSRGGWFEKDIDWIIPVLAFREMFHKRYVQNAIDEANGLEDRGDYLPTIASDFGVRRS